MSRILSAFERFFIEDNWPYDLLEDKPVYKTGFEGSNGQFVCYAHAYEERQLMLFYSLFPVHAPEELRPAIAEFITLANYGMLIGNFEMDYSDGEIRYKTGIDVEDIEIPQALVRQMVYANVLTINKYFTGLMRVLYAGISPADAVEQVESAE